MGEIRRRVSIAGLLCVKPGERTRLIYRTITYHGRRHESKGLGATGFAALLNAFIAEAGLSLEPP